MLHIYLILCCTIVSTSQLIHSMDEDPSAQRPFFETQDKRKLSSENASKRKLSKDKLPKRSSDTPSRKTQNLLALYNISKSDPTLLHTSNKSDDEKEASPRKPSPRSLSPRSAGNKLLPRTTSSAKLPRGLDIKKQALTLIEVFKAKKPNSNLILETLKTYSSDPAKNINELDEFKNTPLHCAILNRSALRAAMVSYEKDIIDPLLTNPRLDTTIKNTHGFTAPQLISGTDFEPDLRKTLFSRNILDREVYQETFNMLMDLHTSDKAIGEIIETVEKNIRQLDTKQGDTDLPEDASFPKYATKEFITLMIQSKTNKEQASVTELYSKNGSLSFFNPNPVEDIFEAAKNSNLPLLEKILDNPRVNPNDQDALGNTALHYAAMCGHTIIVNALLSRSNVSSYIINNKKETAYDLSKKADHTELSEILSIRLALDKKIRDKTLTLTFDHNYKVKENHIIECAHDIYFHHINLPKYITKEFIAQMLSFHVQNLQLDSISIYKPTSSFSQFNTTPLIILDESAKK